ncbi:MAG: type II toxin-antitoxin system VapC family toxin [Actinobacteria bacterium]|nr:type II toxin-antitoxin system VapC family toxin [Actinomycetota bacterium]
MRVFLDTSALVKRYVDEPGSDTIAAVLAEADRLIVSALTLPECVSAFRRLAREGHVTSEQYERLKAIVLLDLSDAVVCHVVPEVIDLAIDCLEQYPLRTLDAMQLAGARAVKPDLFVTSDRRQAHAARSEGLEVVEVPSRGSSHK